MAKDIKFDIEARDGLKRGVDALALSLIHIQMCIRDRTKIHSIPTCCNNFNQLWTLQFHWYWAN